MRLCVGVLNGTIHIWCNRRADKTGLCKYHRNIIAHHPEYTKFQRSTKNVPTI